MSEKTKRLNGIQIKPKTTPTKEAGELAVSSTDNKLKATLETYADYSAQVYNVGDKVRHTDGLNYVCIQLTTGAEDPSDGAYWEITERSIVTEDQTQTLTNKTINADNNTISELETDNFKAGVIDTDDTLAADSDTKIPSQKAVKAYIDNRDSEQDDAAEITYTPSVLTDWDGDTDPGNVAPALDQLAERIDDTEIALTETDTNTDDLVTLSGVAENSTDLGTFTGSTISDTQTIKPALQELETAIETNATNLSDHIIDAVDAHDASAISTDNSGNSLVATEAQASFTEIAGRLDTVEIGISDAGTDLSDHLTDTVDAHDASAISNVPSGNLAATDVQGAVNELQSDIDTRALDSDLTTHIGDTSTHGVTGDIVGTSDSQDLSNKTFTDAVTLEELASTPSTPAVGDKKFYAKNDGKIYTLDSSGVEVEVGSGAGGGGSTQFDINQTTHTFAVGNGIYHNGTSWVKAQADDANTLAYYVVIAVADADNFTAADFGRIEATAHGYTVGQYYFQSDATAGLATSTEPSSGFSNPLFYVEDANTLQVKCYRPDAIAPIALDNLSDVSVPTPTDNQVLSYNNANSRWEAADAVSAAADVTTDNSGNSLTAINAQTSFDEVAGRLDTVEAQGHNLGDLTDVDNAAPAKGDILVRNSVTGNYEALTAGTDGSFLVADSSLDQGIKYNTSISGTLNPVTDWTDCTASGLFVTNATYTTKSRRVGDTLEVVGKIIFDGPTDTANLQINIPDGLILDTSKIESSGLNNAGVTFGKLAYYDSGSTTYHGDIAFFSTTQVNAVIRSTYATNFPQTIQLSNTVPSTIASGDIITYEYKVPILGWSSGVDAAVQQTTLDVPVTTEWTEFTMSIQGNVSDPTKSSTPVIDKAYYRRVGSNMEVKYDYQHDDSTGAAAGDGYYKFMIPNGHTIDLTKMGGVSLYNSIGSAAGYSNTRGYLSGHVSYRGSNFVTLSLGNDVQAVTEVSNFFGELTSAALRYGFQFSVPIVGWEATEPVPAVIAGTFENINSTELVKIKRGISSSILDFPTNTYTKIDFDSVAYDNSSSAYSGGTFTAPKDGYYNFNVKLVFDIRNWAVGETITVRLNRSIGSDDWLGSDTQQTALNYYRHFGSHSTEVFLQQGETVDVELAQSGPATGVTIITGIQETYLSITESADTESIIKNLVGSSEGSSGINYILNPDLEVDTTGYSEYLNTAGVNPVDGTGGTANITIARNTTSPLRGKADLKLSKDAANRQGEGFSYNFTIDSADKARKLTCSFDYDASHVGYADGDIRLSVYDVTNSRLIRVNGEDLKGGKGKHYFQFQTSSDSVSYRLIAHVSSTNASAYDVYFDNFELGPREVARGNIITDWKAYTPTFTGLGTPTGVDIQSRRVGGSLEIQGQFTSGGTVSGATATFSIPSGLSIDEIGENAFYGSVTKQGTTSVYGTFASSPTTIGFSTETYSGVTGTQFEASKLASFTLSVPIQGWSSDAVQSSDLGGREIYAGVVQSGTQSISNGTWTDITFWNTPYSDTTASWSSASNHYVIPESGYYFLEYGLGFNVNATGSRAVALKINGSGPTSVELAATSPGDVGIVPSRSTVMYRNKGDTIGVMTYQSSGGALNATAATFIITKLASPQTILDTETVAARYTSNSGQSIGTSNVIEYEDIDYDTHNAYNTSTGEYTVPVSGYYQINAIYSVNAAAFSAGSFLACSIDVGGSNITNHVTRVQRTATDSYQCSTSATLYLNKSDVLTIEATTGVSCSLATLSNENMFQIERIK